MNIFKQVGIQEVVPIRPHGPVSKVFNVHLDEKKYLDWVNRNIAADGSIVERKLTLNDLITIIDNQAWHGVAALSLSVCHFGGTVKRLAPSLYEVTIFID